MTRGLRRDVIAFLGLCWLAVGLAESARAEGDEASHHRQGPAAVHLGGRSPDRARRFAGGVREGRGRRGKGRLRDLHLARPGPGRGTGNRAAAADQRPARHRAPMVTRWDPVDLRTGRREGREAAAAPALPAVVRRGRAQTADRPAQRGLVAGLVARWQVRRLPERDHARRPRQGPAGQEGRKTGTRERRPDRHAGRVPPR